MTKTYTRRGDKILIDALHQRSKFADLSLYRSESCRRKHVPWNLFEAAYTKSKIWRGIELCVDFWSYYEGDYRQQLDSARDGSTATSLQLLH